MSARWETELVLVVLSGLPGVGKSAIAEEVARRLQVAVISVDAIEAAILRSGIPQSFETGFAAYNVGAAIAEPQLAAGLTVIADAANYFEVGRAIWRSAAQRADVAWLAVNLVCSDEAEHRRRLRARQRRLDPFPEPTWANVQQWRDETEPWTGECLVLDTVHPINDNVERLLEYMSAQPEPTIKDDHGAVRS